MNAEEIKNLIDAEVTKKISEEKKQLARMVETKFLYTGQYAGAAKLIDVIKDWSLR